MKEKLKVKENKVSLEVLVLESVGSCIDGVGITYPLQVDGTPDKDNGVHILDIEPQEWWDSLSVEDYNLVESVRIKIQSDDDKCFQCGKIPAKIDYKDEKYCTWYCAKKESK